MGSRCLFTMVTQLQTKKAIKPIWPIKKKKEEFISSTTQRNCIKPNYLKKEK